MAQPAVISLLADLVAIPSVNPSLVEGGAGEGAIADAIALWMRRQRFDVDVEHVLPGRPNVVGIVDSGRPGPTVMFCGHTDTVGTDGMESPFDPVVVEDRLYGRGAQDMKSGIAAMLFAAADLADAGRLSAGRLIVACIIDEEFASAGADALVKRWSADAAVITEPTGLSIGVAHKGFSAAEIVVHGRAAHGSRPSEGLDAIVRMGRVLSHLERLDDRLRSAPPDPLLGNASLHASTIVGGGELSTYPARCCLQMERRTLPGEALTTAEDELRAAVAELSAQDRHFEAEVRLLLARHPYAISPDHWVTQTMMGAIREANLDVRLEGLSYWTDAAVLGSAQIPTILFGPRGQGLHSTSESVLVEDVEVCRRVLARFAANVARPR
jgi:acetylornithine deacetylase